MAQRTRMRAAVKGSVAALVVLGAIAVACGDSERGIAPGDAVAGGDADAVGDTEGDVAGPATPPNACGEGGSCPGQRACRSGVCVSDPPGGTVATLTDPRGNVPTSEAPDLSCADGSSETPAVTGEATLYGAVARFGGGRRTVDMLVEVLLAEGFDPVTCEQVTGANPRRDCYRDHGTVVGSAVSVPAPEAPADPCEAHEDCLLGYQCVEISSIDHRCSEAFGLFEIEGVPTNTPLILRTRPTQAAAGQWHDTYVFNVVLPEERVGADGRIQYDATIVSAAQWLLTANTVGISDIGASNGVIGGRVRDCPQSSRVSWPIAEVSLDLATRARRIVYFNHLEDDTVPLVDRVTTNILGRFAALDVPAGWNTVAGSARVGGEVVSVGAQRVYVVPNALVIVSWPGNQPHWRQN